MNYYTFFFLDNKHHHITDITGAAPIAAIRNLLELHPNVAQADISVIVLQTGPINQSSTTNL